jgi:tetratricopeptide (TPR) repeat protein
LLPASAGAAVLVTSRTVLPGLHLHVPIVLDILPIPDSVRLLGRLVDQCRVDAEPAAAREIADLCGGLPLAVRIAGARLAARRGWPLAVLAGRLRDEHRRLDELVAGDLEVRASLALTYRSLPEEIRSGFRHLGVLGPAEFSPWLLAALTDVPLSQAEHVTERLADAQLLDAAGIGADGEVRYRLHDLVQLYARERAAAEEPVDEHRAAIQRLMEQLLALIDAVGGRAPASAPTLVDQETWFEQERRTLVAAVELASRLGLHRVACEVSAALLILYQRQNSFDDWWRTHDAALGATRSAGDQRGEAVLLRGLGRLRYEQDRMGESRGYYVRALHICREQDDLPGLASALIGVATIDRELGQFASALRNLGEAAKVCDRLGDLGGLAECAYGRGYIHRELGEFGAARMDLDSALAAYRKIGDRRGEGLTLRSMAMVFRATGELCQAARFAQQSVDVFCDMGNRLLTAYGMQALAKVQIRQLRPVEAERLLETSLAVCEKYGDRFGIALVLRTLGELNLSTGDLTVAAQYLTRSLALWEELGLQLFQARVQRDLAELHHQLGDDEAAAAARSAALETFRRYGTREYGELESQTAAIPVAAGA